VRILRAILFDFDGVIVDSEALHHRAYELVLARHGVASIPFEVYADRFSNRGVGLEYCADQVPGIDLVELKRQKEQCFQKLLEDDARLLPGAAEVIRELAAQLPLSIATGSMRRAALHVLERFELLDNFRAVIAREDYVREKPAPDAFLRACEALGEPPASCLVVEDSNKGLRAAVAAGIPCVVVPNTYTRAGDFAQATAQIGTLRALSLERAIEIHGAA
jgi:HAD superfamily hydrolase (TIGR01509 family)